MDYLLHDFVRSNAERYGDKEAIVAGKTRLTYGQLQAAVNRLAAGLQRRGMKRGDRVGVLLPPGAELAQAIFAISAAGCAFVPIHHSLRLPQVSHIAADCQMRALITCASLLPQVDPAIASANDFSLILTDEAPAENQIRCLTVAEVTSSDRRCQPIGSTEGDLAAILYTSGSTGKPKGVMLSHKNIVAGASIVSDYLAIDSDDRILAALPFSFDAGLNQLTTAIQQGATLVSVNFIFAKQIVDALIDERITGLAGVPPLWSLLTQPSSTLARRQPESLRYITNTGGAMPAHVLANLRQALPEAKVFLMYGLTEAFRSTYLPPEELDRRPGSIGKAIPNTEILVVDADGKPCPPGEVGELVHRGPTVSLGYWGRPDLTERVIRLHPFPATDASREERVVYSGDLVHTDEDGYLYFVGRRDNMIKSSGFRVSPNEVEEALCRTGLVQLAAVVGIPDEMLGQRIEAFVVPFEGKPLDVGQLLAACSTRLANHMVPKKVIEVDALPKTASGKVSYQTLREEAIQSSDVVTSDAIRK